MAHSLLSEDLLGDRSWAMSSLIADLSPSKNLSIASSTVSPRINASGVISSSIGIDSVCGKTPSCIISEYISRARF